MAKPWNWWTRKLHRWGAILIAVPLLIVIISGLMLQLKKEISWIQPPTAQGSASIPAINWDQILAVAQQNKAAEVASWEDIDRLDVRIGKGVIKIRCNNGWELQIDSVSGEQLSSARRRSDLIENIHDGSFFSEAAKLWIFLPSGIVLLSLWITGAWLWYLPISVRKAKRTARKGKFSV